MVATFSWKEYNGAGSTESTPTHLNFVSIDAANADASTNPITAGGHSYEKWIKADFSDSFTSIDNIKFWKSAGAYVTGETIDWKGDGQTSYSTPTDSESTIAVTAVPTSEPGEANVSIGGATSGQLTAAGKTDFIVLQKHVSTAADPGQTNTLTFTISYDEV